jgi:hypothetical protein
MDSVMEQKGTPMKERQEADKWFAGVMKMRMEAIKEKKVEKSSQLPQDLETEAKDGKRAGDLRLYKARHQSLQLTGRIPESLRLPSDTPETMGLTSKDKRNTSK